MRQMVLLSVGVALMVSALGGCGRASRPAPQAQVAPVPSTPQHVETLPPPDSVVAGVRAVEKGKPGATPAGSRPAASPKSATEAAPRGPRHPVADPERRRGGPAE